RLQSPPAIPLHLGRAMKRIRLFESKLATRFLEVDRLAREGATLKNVAENMRTITIAVTMLIVVGLLMDVPTSIIRVAAIAWGCWAFVYALLAAAQAGILLALVLGEVPLLKNILIRIGFLRGAIATGFAVLVVIIMAVSCVLFDPKHMLHW
ncbi:hypothetical protein, partial [Stenotrophomonas maltophilia]|uniref:hypothetical protein n=2 Tax=Stenotrophomonas maltophilia TaxID=40324 RepID=UPI0021556D46